MAEIIGAIGDILSEKMQHCYNKVSDGGEMPKEWKNANIILLLGKGDEAFLENYRSHHFAIRYIPIVHEDNKDQDKWQLVEEQSSEQASYFLRALYPNDHLYTVGQILKRPSNINNLCSWLLLIMRKHLTPSNTRQF